LLQYGIALNISPCTDHFR